MAVRSGGRGAGLAEYRLDDLARLSGVSARNIRAYRERGLLDPPRRVGRSAYYGEAHLAQLRAIGQLLAKGFSSAHIAEFFDGLRTGRDLVDDLGIRGLPLASSERRLDLAASDDDAIALVHLGLAELVDGAVQIRNPSVAAIVAAADDQRRCVRAIVRLAMSTHTVVDELTERITASLGECLAIQPEPRCRALALSVVADRVAHGVDRALRARAH